MVDRLQHTLGEIEKKADELLGLAVQIHELAQQRCGPIVFVVGAFAWVAATYVLVAAHIAQELAAAVLHIAFQPAWPSGSVRAMAAAAALALLAFLCGAQFVAGAVAGAAIMTVKAA